MRKSIDLEHKVHRLTLSRARELIKRELGVSTMALEKPEVMNKNSHHPYYQMLSGYRLISVYETDEGDYPFGGRMVVLSVQSVKSADFAKEYFYGDTLEYAGEYTELQNRVEFCCKCNVSYLMDDTYQQLKNETLEAGRNHFKQ